MDIEAARAHSHGSIQHILDAKAQHIRLVVSLRSAWETYCTKVKYDVLSNRVNREDVKKAAMISDNMGVLFIPSDPRILATEGLKAEALVKCSIGGTMSMGDGSVHYEVFSEVSGNENANTVIDHTLARFLSLKVEYPNLNEMWLLTDLHSTERSVALVVLLDYLVRVRQVLGSQGCLHWISYHKDHHDNELDRANSPAAKKFTKLATTIGVSSVSDLLVALKPNSSYNATFKTHFPDYCRSLQSIITDPTIRKNLEILPSRPILRFDLEGVRSKNTWEEEWSAWRTPASEIIEPLTLWPQNTPLPTLSAQPMQPFSEERREKILKSLSISKVNWRADPTWQQLLHPTPFVMTEYSPSWPAFPEGDLRAPPHHNNDESTVLAVTKARVGKSGSYEFKTTYAGGWKPSWQPASDLIDRRSNQYDSILNAALETFLQAHVKVRGKGALL